MFLNIENRSDDEILAVDSKGDKIVCRDIPLISDEIRRVTSRAVSFNICDNTVGALAAYLASVEAEIVPVMLSHSIDKELLESLFDVYEPAYVWIPSETEIPFKNCVKLYEMHNYSLYRTDKEIYPIHKDLQLLMTTSGSTGSPKLVRYKKGNLEANAKNVANAFGWSSAERPLCDLAMNYTMGLNVVNTHIYAGATIFLTNANIMSSEYWDYIKENRLTNITGVPFSYELMLKLRFTRMDLPYLTTLAEGGGKLNDKIFKTLAEYARDNGKRFVATFGTTETSARMAMLDPELALDKIGSIGKAIPEGRLFLTDEKGNEIDTPNTEGELTYSGPNVTMGYAIRKEDLLKDDEFCGTYHTGDIAIKDEDGFFYVVGRKSRFIKLLGYRVSLDQCERFIKDEFNIECACVGSDDHMKIYIVDESKKKLIVPFLSKKTGFFKTMFDTVVIKELPKNESGKIMYKNLV